MKRLRHRGLLQGLMRRNMQRMKRLAAEAKATAAARFASKPSSKPAGPKASERFRAAAMDFHRRASESMAALREKKKAPEKPVQRKPAFASPVATDPASPSANCFSIGDDEEGDELDYQSPQNTPPQAAQIRAASVDSTASMTLARCAVRWYLLLVSVLLPLMITMMTPYTTTSTSTSTFTIIL